MVNKYYYWWLPGLFSIPFILVSPSLGFATLAVTLLFLILLRFWAKRSMTRVLYINEEIDKGVIFRKKITMMDQIQYRRKSMVLTYDSVVHYVKTRKMMACAMIFLTIYVVGYSTFNWFKNPTEFRGGIEMFTEPYWKQVSIATTVIVGVLVSLSCLLSFLRISYFLSCLKEPNLPGGQKLQTQEEKEAAVERVRQSAAAGKSGGFLSSVAHMKPSAEAEEQAMANAERHEAAQGSIAAMARIDVSDDRPVMTRDEKIEAAHQAALEAEAKAAEAASKE